MVEKDDNESAWQSAASAVKKDDNESAWQSAAYVVEKDDQEESYDAYLARERHESAQHYLKPYRKKFWVCWGLLAAAGLLILNRNFGLALLCGLPPMIYMWSIYSVAYSPGQMGMSRGQSFRMVFIGVPLAIFLLLSVLGELLSDQDAPMQSPSETTSKPPESREGI